MSSAAAVPMAVAMSVGEMIAVGFFDPAATSTPIIVAGTSWTPEVVRAMKVTIEFVAVGRGTKLIITENGAFLDGYEDAGSRERGTLSLMDNLERALGGGDIRRGA